MKNAPRIHKNIRKSIRLFRHVLSWAKGGQDLKFQGSGTMAEESDDKETVRQDSK